MTYLVDFLAWVLATLWNAILDAVSAALNAQWHEAVGGGMGYE